MTDERGELLFCYGTLQRAEVQVAEIGRALAGSPDRLEGYRALRLPIDDPAEAASNGAPYYLALAPGEGEPIAGTVYALTRDELARADAYETDDYIRRRVTLASGREAWVYCAAAHAKVEM